MTTTASFVSGSYVNGEPTTDLDLVAASRQGSREAFGQIVRRYQGMIAGLIYSSCGDIHRSEDLAQETFIAAWKSLSGLREPAKLAAWLCQIARHRLLDQNRSVVREDVRMARAMFDRKETTPPSSPPPEQELLSSEGQELLWKTLAAIPQPYRETLVLYYRHGRSTEDVASAMETTEATVRQRLSRGREMMRDQLASTLERGLERSTPSPAFTIAVIAALPPILPQVVATTTASAAVAKGAAAAKGSGVLATVGLAIGPIMGLIGGILGTAQAIRQTESPVERRFVVRSSIITWVTVLAFMASLLALSYLNGPLGLSKQGALLVFAAVWVGYIALIIILARRMRRRQDAIRQAQGHADLATKIRSEKLSGFKVFWNSAVWGLAGTAWMIGLAAAAQDTLVVVILTTIACVQTFVGMRWLRGRTMFALRRFTVGQIVFTATLTFVMVNWRLQSWIATMDGQTIDQVRRQTPLWSVNLMLLIAWAMVLAISYASLGASRSKASC